MQQLAQRHSQKIIDENQKLRSELESKMSELNTRSKELDEIAAKSDYDRRIIDQEKQKVCVVAFAFSLLRRGIIHLWLPYFGGKLCILFIFCCHLPTTSDLSVYALVFAFHVLCCRWLGLVFHHYHATYAKFLSLELRMLSNQAILSWQRWNKRELMKMC